MITVNAILETNSSNIEKIKSSIEEMEQETLKEKGCQDYVFSVELNNSATALVTAIKPASSTILLTSLDSKSFPPPRKAG